MVDHRADIYACATLIYQSLTGQLPYSARNILVMVEMKAKADARTLNEAMPGLVDARLEAFVARGLARDPALRFQTALDALAAWRDLRPPQGPSSQPGSGQGGPPPRTVGGGRQSARPLSAQSTRPNTPSIQEQQASLPRLPDLVEMTTDETAATLAMPMPHLQQRKSQGGSQAPKLQPRLEASAASAGGGPQTPRPVGPGGTQPVMISRMLERAAERKPGANDPTVEDKSGNLPSHPAGYYIPPSVAASLARVSPQNPALMPPQGPPPAPPPPVNPATPSVHASVPRLYEDPASLPVPSSEVATHIYRPRQEDTARRVRPEPSLPVPVSAQKRLPLLVLLFGFLVVGFVVVAGALYMLRRAG
jgi:serine/threonine-protein kinase